MMHVIGEFVLPRLLIADGCESSRPDSSVSLAEYVVLAIDA